MRKLTYFLLAISLWSCGTNTKGVDSKIYTEKQVSDFIRVNPNWTSADQQVTERFKHRMINMSNEADFLKDLPVQLTGYVDTTLNGQATKLAVFKSYIDNQRDPKSLLNDLQYEIDGIVSEEQTAKLKVNQHYMLAGSVFKQGKRGNINLIEMDGKKTYLLGKYIFLITAFKQ